MTRFRCVVLLCLLLGVALLSPQRLRAAPLDPDDAMLFDIRLDTLRMGDGARGFQTDKGICVDFADVASALDVAVTLAPDRQSAAGWVFDEHTLLNIDRTNSVVKAHGRTDQLQAGDITDTAHGWCVLTDVLARWLGVSIEADTLNALLLVHSDTPLPAQQARARSAEASLLDARNDAAAEKAAETIRTLAIPYRLWRTPSFDVSAQFGMNEGHVDRSAEVYAAGEALWLSLDARLATDNNGQLSALRARLYRSDPDAGLLGSLRATEFAVGDVSSAASRLVAQSVSGRGLFLTNRPLGQASQFDTTSFEGDLPQGWDVELFRNGELIGLSQGASQGRYRFLSVPLVYGSNLFEIVRHGPQGQVRRERHIYEVGPSAVPPRTLWWSANSVERNRDLIGIVSTRYPSVSWHHDIGAEYGIDKRTSVAASLHSLVRTGVRHSIAEAELRRGIGTMTATITGAADLAKGRALMLSGLGRAAGFRFTVHALFNHGLDADLVDTAVRSAHQVNLDRELSLGHLLLPVHFDLGAINRVDGSKTRSLALRTSLSVAGISTTVTGKLTQTALPARPYGPVEGGVGLLVGGRIGSVALRGDLNYRLGVRCAFSDAQVTGQWSLSPKDSWQVGAGYSWETKTTSYRFGYSHDFGKFTLSMTGSGDTSGTMTTLLGLRFSIGPDAGGRLNRLSSSPLASSGTVAVSIYRDGNGDTLRQADEPLEDRANLLIGGQPAKTTRNSTGTLVLDGLAPASAVTLGVDPASLSDPLLDPAEPAVRLISRKGLTVHVEMAVAASGVIEGMVRQADGSAAAGQPVTLLDSAGHEVMRTTSDFDGSFVFEKIRYGRYGLRTASPLSPLAPVVLDSEHPLVRVNLL